MGIGYFTNPCMLEFNVIKNYKIIVEKHSDGYGAYPLGLRGVDVGEGNTYQIALVRESDDGTRTPMTIPTHCKIKGSTLRTLLTQAGISRADFSAAYDRI